VVTVASLMMASVAFGATMVKVGTPTTSKNGSAAESVTSSNTVWVPISYESTDYKDLSNFDIYVKFDTDKYTIKGFTNNTSVVDDDDEVKYLLSAGGDTTMQADGIYHLIVYASTDIPEGYPVGYLADATDYKPILWARFTPKSDTTVKETDFAVKVNSISYYKDNNEPQINITSDERATYVTYDVPKEVGEDWSYGYIHSLKAVIKEAGTENVLTTQDISNCIDTGDSYQFVVKLVPSTLQAKTVVDVEFVAATAKTDAADAETTDVTVNTVSNVAVEYLK
jgi:hypothetical protein